jgi:hypothetical protein
MTSRRSVSTKPRPLVREKKVVTNAWRTPSTAATSRGDATRFFSERKRKPSRKSFWEAEADGCRSPSAATI